MDLGKISTHLNELKDNLIYTVQSSENTSDLSSRLIELTKTDPDNADIYQLIVLVNSNLETDHKSFKAITIKIINDMITSKLTILQTLGTMDTRVKTLESKIKAETKGVKVPFVGNLKLKDLWLFVVSLFTILVLSYKIVPQETAKVMEGITTISKKGGK